MAPNSPCQLHLDLLKGLAKGLGPAGELSLSVRDPRRIKCRVKVKVANETSPGSQPHEPDDRSETSNQIFRGAQPIIVLDPYLDPDLPR